MPEEMNYSEQEAIRREKLKALRAAGHDPYLLTKCDVTATSKKVLADYDALEGQTVSLAGRMMSRRVMGKASFAHLLDCDGEIQFYVRRDDVGEETYAAFKDMDLGDLVYIRGFVF